MRNVSTFAALAALALACPVGAADFQWSGQLNPGQKIEVYGINGAIHAGAGSGASVAGHKRARRSNPDLVEIKAVEHAGGVTICAIYPDSGGTCTPGHGLRGGHGTRDNDVSVDFTVQVPSGVAAVLHTVNGEIEARDLDGDVTAETVNGSVDVNTRGMARAQTVNGSLTASMGQADWRGELEMSTVNGSIRIEVPDGTGALVEAQTVNGDIESDFDGITVSGRRGPRHARGTIGSGGRELSLSTVNGSIELRRR